MLDSMFEHLLKDTQEEVDLRKSIKENKLLLAQPLNEQERIIIYEKILDDLGSLNSILISDCKQLFEKYN